MAGTVHWYWGNMAWVCISQTSQPPSVHSSTPSSLTWVKAVCHINPLEILTCFPLLHFLWEQAALRWTWADLKEGKRANFMKTISLARKERPTEADKMQRLGLELSERESYLVSLGWEGRDTTSKVTQAPRGHTKWVCKLKKSGTLNPTQSIKSPDVTSYTTGKPTRWRWGWEGDGAHPSGWGVGWKGCRGWLDVRECPSLEKRRQVSLGVTTQKGLDPVKQNAPPAPGTWNCWGSPFLCCQQTCQKPAGQTSCPSVTFVHRKWRQEMHIAVMAH